MAKSKSKVRSVRNGEAVRRFGVESSATQGGRRMATKERSGGKPINIKRGRKTTITTGCGATIVIRAHPRQGHPAIRLDAPPGTKIEHSPDKDLQNDEGIG